IICAATSVRTDTGHYSRPATGVGQLRALGHIVESLSKAYDVKIHNILLSDDQVQKQIEDDIIVLGGPKNNVITKLLLDKINEARPIANQFGNTIHWLVKGQEMTVEGTRLDNTVVKDYGLIIRTANPFAKRGNPTAAAIFAGCHTYGTIAAAKYFTESYIEHARWFRSIPRNVALLVECDVIDGYPVAIKLLKAHEF
ncbi:MAG: hypothetical protein KDC54_04755, partial [Lewinella sp.]|nr:hypothetical protein [Lewinella sp.]